MIQTFEDLVAWQKARELAAGVHRMTAGRRFERRAALRDQVERASVSVMSNLAEGFDRYRPAEFIHFLDIAKGSCAEVRSLLYVALDTGAIGARTFEAARERSLEVSRLIGALLSSFRKATKPRRAGLRTPDSGLGTHRSGSKLPVKAAEGEQ